MHQLSAERLQLQVGQLPMKDRNPYVLNYDHVELNPNCRTSQQPAAPVDARYTMTYSTQSPEVTHLYPAAAQPFYRGDANCTPVFNDYGKPVFHLEPRKRGLFMVSTTHIRLQDLADTMTTLCNSWDHQQRSNSSRKRSRPFTEWTRSTLNVRTTNSMLTHSGQ